MRLEPPALLLGVLSATVALLWLTSVPEVFTIDDCNYLATVLALRDGGLFLAGTEGLSPSAELASFDPTAHMRVVTQTPVAPTAPPLYAPLALPWSYLGFEGLIAINALCVAAIGWLVFQLAKALGRQPHTPWVALAAFVLGGFCIDYGQGVWPHMLSVALCTAAVWLAFRARREARWRDAALAGLLAGWAIGVRYQNIVLCAALGVTLLIWSRRRLQHGALFAAGAALPLLASGLINAVRIGSFNPISKGPGYFGSSSDGMGVAARGLDALATLYVRIVDYSAHPPFSSAHGRAALPKDPETGVFLVVGGLKKALLQSAPWIAIALCVLVLAWTRWSSPSPNTLTSAQRRELRALSVVVVAVLALFAWAGLERHDGWSFNQRYLLELVPLFAVATALAVDGWSIDRTSDRSGAVLGGAAGVALALIPIVAVPPEHWFRQRLIMWLPLAIAALLLACWAAGARSASLERLRVALLAASIGWAFALHLGDDVQAARNLRSWHGFQREAVSARLPPGATALIAGLGQKEALCPLQLERDLIIVDPSADGGRDAGVLTSEMLAAGRRVLVVGGLPEPVLQSIFAGRALLLLAAEPIPMAEVVVTEPATP